MAEQDANPQNTPEATGPGSGSAAGSAPAPARAPAEAAAQALDAAKAEINSMNSTLESATVGGTPSAAGAAPYEMPSFDSGAAVKATVPDELELLGDVNLNVKVELGRTRMLVDDVLRLCEGAVVELDKLAGDPVDIYVNDQHVARGEVLVLNDNFCVRISEIVNPTN